MTKHPIQPLEIDANGILRFKSNKIVCFLLEHGGYDLNKISVMEFPRNDREQFAQLIGYSLSGFCDLSYVSEETYEKVCSQKLAKLALKKGILESIIIKAIGKLTRVND